MSVRHRSRTTPHIGGTAVWHGAGNVNPVSSSWNVFEDMYDTADSPGSDHPLTLSVQDNIMWTMSGTSRNPTSGSYWAYNGYAKTATYGTGHQTPTTVRPSDGASLSAGLALNNPSRPSVSLTKEIIENTRDLPRTLRDHWENLLLQKNRSGNRRIVTDPRFLANNYLEWQFDWLPLYRFLFKMTQFHSLVNKRLRMLKSLQTTGSVHRTATIWSDEKVSSVSTTVATPLYSESNTVWYRYRTTSRRWVATKYWVVGQLPENDTALYDLAVRLTYDKGLSASDLWELLPWSWLFDWFGNVGDVLNAYRNDLPVTHEGSCIMDHQVTGIEVTNLTGPGAGFARAESNYGRRYETKLRSVAGPTPPLAFSVPFLNGAQASILGSLIVSRKTR